ncbi:MAG: histidine kinase dimerization/phospho-acceptor domain-containing protein, partial [bacterium]
MMPVVGIRGRLTAWYASLLIVVLVVLGAVVYSRFSAMLWLRAEDSLHSRFDHVASLVGAPQPNEPNRPPLPELSEPRVIEGMSGEGGLIEIVDTRGRVVNHSRALTARPLAPPSAVRAALAGGRSLQSVAVPGLGPFLVYTAPLLDNGALVGAAEVGVPMTRITEPLTNLRRLLLIGGAAAFAVIVLGGYFLASQGLAPIDRIVLTARAIGSNGALDRRIRLTGPNDEVGRLGRVFDEMLERIEQVVKRERRFTADAAHELRTPLTILKGEIDVALRHDRSAAEYRTALMDIADETNRLSRLVDGLLLL